MVAASALLAVTVVFGAELQLSPEEARRLAWQALHRGQAETALRFADALTKRTPDAYDIAVLRFEALAALGRKRDIGPAARKVWSLAATDKERYGAAQRIAKLHFDAGEHIRAQFWLRRAEHVAPTDSARDMAVRNFRFVRANNPLSVTLHFAVLPTRNINNGSTNDTVMVNGIPFQVPTTGQPHSGTGFSVAVDTVWRTPVTNGTHLRLGVSARSTTYRLSSESRALGSGLRGSDFASMSVELKAGLSFAPPKDATVRGMTHVDLTLGRSWYGGNPLANYARIDLRHGIRLNRSTHLEGSAGIERQWRLDDARASADVLSLGATLAHGFDTGARVQAGLSLRDTRSQSAIVDSQRIGASLAYDFAPIAWDIRPSVSFDLSRTDYSRLPLGPGGSARQDDRAVASLTLFFPKASYYGFAPTATLSASRNKSNVAIYDSRDLRLSLGIRSTF